VIIYLDESGDLGFDFTKKGTTRFFVISVLVCLTGESDKAIQRAIKRTRKNKLRFKTEELKGVNTSPSIKEYFLRNIRGNAWGIYTVVLNKSRVKKELQTKIGKRKLYNFLSRVLIEKIHFPDDLPALTLIVDKMKNKREIKDFNQYLENQLSAYLPLNCMFYVYHKDSKEHPGLQAVDLFCWGIFRKYTMHDKSWYQLYKHKIVLETVYLR
jgi:hypothetical protein